MINDVARYIPYDQEVIDDLSWLMVSLPLTALGAETFWCFQVA